MKHKIDPVDWAKKAEEAGAGELIITSINNEGTWDGFDIEIIKSITDSISIPVIANGGAGSLTDIGNVVKNGGASAVGLGNLVVYQQKGMGVLVNSSNIKR